MEPEEGRWRFSQGLFVPVPMFSRPHEPGSPDVCRPGVQAQRETPASLWLLGPIVAPSMHGRGICGLLGVMRCPLRWPPASWEEMVPGMAAAFLILTCQRVLPPARCPETQSWGPDPTVTKN